MPEQIVPNPDPVHRIREQIAAGQQRFTRTAMRAVLDELDRVAAERDAGWFEVMDRRTDIATLHNYVEQLQQSAADHPSLVARLTCEVEEWATRCGAAEAERDELLDAMARS